MIQTEVLRGVGLGLCVEIFGGAYMFVPEVEEFDMGVCELGGSGVFERRW